MQFIKDHFPVLATAHLEKRKGTDAQASNYCLKEKSKIFGPFEVGSNESRQGERSDIATYAAAITEYARSGQHTWKSACRLLVERFPGTHLAMRQKGQGVWEDSLLRMESELQRPLVQWQQQLLEDVEGPVSTRKIIWICGAAGGEGKSTMAMHLIHQHDALMLSGRVQDMAYAYTNQTARVVIFDLPRTMTGEGSFMDHYYSFAEQLKNGCIFSAKYNSGQVVFQRPHVIFFANVEPDMTKWSADRYDVRVI